MQPNTTTWGGNILKGDGEGLFVRSVRSHKATRTSVALSSQVSNVHDVPAIRSAGEYHMYVSRMTNNCLLNDWRKNSRIDHAVSKSMTGPFEFKDVAVSTWAHNAAPVQLKD